MKNRQLITALCALFATSNSVAADYYCGGYVEYVFESASGDVGMKFTIQQGQSSSGKVSPSPYPVSLKICNVEAPWQSVGVATCRGWLALMMSANLKNAPSAPYYVYMYFDDQAQATCNAIVAYPNTTVRPTRVMLGY